MRLTKLCVSYVLENTGTHLKEGSRVRPSMLSPLSDVPIVRS